MKPTVYSDAHWFLHVAAPSIAITVILIAIATLVLGCSDPVTPPPVVNTTNSPLSGSWITYADKTHWFQIELNADLSGTFREYNSPVFYSFQAVHPFTFETQTVNGVYYSFEGLAGDIITGELQKHFDPHIYSYWQTEWRRY